MRKSLIIIAFLLTGFLSNAQFEAKLNPIGALFGRPDLSAEYIVSDNLGVEGTLSFAFGKVAGVSIEGSERPTQSGIGFGIGGKYYFSPDVGGDGWYAGVYLRAENLTISYPKEFDDLNYKSSIFAAGLQFGRKWVFDSGFLIDAGFGIGRPLSEKRSFTNVDSDYNVNFEIGLDYTAKLAIGYRFGM